MFEHCLKNICRTQMLTKKGMVYFISLPSPTYGQGLIPVGNVS